MGDFGLEVVRAYIDSQFDRIRVLGYEVESCLVDIGDTAERVLTEQPGKCTFDCAGCDQPISRSLTSRIAAAGLRRRL
jgi:hypothetical protein